MKRIVAKPEYCMNCRLCEIHCVVAHSQSKDIIKAFKKEKGQVPPRVTVEQAGPVTFAVQCRHCDESPCVAACMTGALTRDPETGWVKHDPDKCVGCWMCVMTCPAGAIVRDKYHHAAAKCDLCAALGEPACVANCPNEALVVEEF